MALIKIYSEPKNIDILRNEVSKVIKNIAAAALNSTEIPTGLNTIETILGEGIDLIGIDYIIEIIACKRPNMQKIADKLIYSLNVIYPDKKFSVYFNLIETDGMANTPRPPKNDIYITMDEAIKRCQEIIKQ